MRRIILAATIAMLAACGDDAMTDVDARNVDAAVDAGGGADASCFANPNPNSHVEIINACTEAEKIYKNPILPLTLPDGGVAPIP